MVYKFFLTSILVTICFIPPIESLEILSGPQSPCSLDGIRTHADCNDYDMDILPLSVWNGNYTCNDDDIEIQFVINITNSSSTMELQGYMFLGMKRLHLDGSFASFFNVFAIQSEDLHNNNIAGRDISKLELNGKVQSSVFIDGGIVFQTDSGQKTCPMELRRQTVFNEMNWCNGNGRCHRYGSRKPEYKCCCDRGYTGDTCNTAMVMQTSTPVTTPTTTRQAVEATSSPPCVRSVYNCSMRFNCDHNGKRTCVDGYTGSNCDTVIPAGFADCDTFDSDVFIPSRWAGNYTCVSDDVLVKFTLSVTKSSIDQLDLDGVMYINNEIISTGGSYANAFGILTLQSNDVIRQDIFGGNITNVELNGLLRSPVFMDGVIVFNDENRRFNCPMELRRVQVLVKTSWCNGHGKCHRYGSKRDQYRCCCDPGFAGDTCLTRITSSYTSSTVTSAVKTTAVTPMTSTTATSTSTTTDTTGSTSVQGLKLENAIHPGCTSYGWNIYVDMSILKHLNPTMSSSHVYFGDTSCRGRLNGTVLIFQQGFRDCLTSERVSNDTFIYDNDLFYATYDPIYPFIIRQHNWTFTVECDVSRSEATAFHVHHVVDSHLAAVRDITT